MLRLELCVAMLSLFFLIAGCAARVSRIENRAGERGHSVADLMRG
jgi:hypothetical protein